MTIVAGGSRSFERRQDLLVFLLKNGSVTGHWDAARGGLCLHLIFGQSKTLPEANSSMVYERGIVVEPKRVNAGRRRGIVVSQADISKGKIARPVCVVTHQHVVGIHRNLRMRHAVR